MENSEYVAKTYHFSQRKLGDSEGKFKELGLSLVGFLFRPKDKS